MNEADDPLVADRSRWHPALGAVVVGLVMAALTVFVGLRAPVEATLWAVLLGAFAVWGSFWIRTPDFGAGLWLGLFLGTATPVVQAVFYGTYAANNPWYADDLTGRGMVLGFGLLVLVPYSILLGLVQWSIQKVRSRDLEAMPPVPAHE